MTVLYVVQDFSAKLGPASGGATKPIPHPASTPTPAGEGAPLEAARECGSMFALLPPVLDIIEFQSS